MEGARRRGQEAGGQGRTAAVVDSIELDGPIGSHTVEAVRLEIRRLARACGLDLVDVRVETRGKGPQARARASASARSSQ